MKAQFAKGGRADRKKGVLSDFNQIPFFEWLVSLTREQVASMVNNAGLLRINDFELSSLQDLPWFQNLSLALNSKENLPDCFHLWTARRNGIDIFLTLEKKLPRIIRQLKNRNEKRIDINVPVLRPTDLLQLLAITELDVIPIEPNRFYSLAEIFHINRKLLEG